MRGEDVEPENTNTLALRILGPVTKFVNRSWKVSGSFWVAELRSTYRQRPLKMYPVGVLFGLGFDTASSIALLAVTAIAQRGADGAEIPHSYIVILPVSPTPARLLSASDHLIHLASLHSWHDSRRLCRLCTHALLVCRLSRTRVRDIRTSRLC